ncbi:MAG: hypothetical protein ABIO44_03630 [Saprospiraceae bacterium]
MRVFTNLISSSGSLIIVLSLFISYRFVHIHNNSQNGYNATTWDALGYYMYLPSVFIYHDVRELKWMPQIDSTYHVTGGKMYQAFKYRGNEFYTNKYLCGVAIIQAPFFIAAHYIAPILNEPQDGFSSPYQYAILLAAIFWSFLGFVILRKVLLKYFSDNVTSITILFIAFTSNLIQYISVDGAMSHAFIFPLYAIILWLTISWHNRPKSSIAFFIGFIIGLATISRPTEFIMILIPLFWNTHSKEFKYLKWQTVVKNKFQVLLSLAGGIIGILPQLIYWKYTTGKLIIDVGSKWFLLTPWFRGLFGPEIGWFIYTPVAILMVLGFFFMKDQPFKKSVIIFCLINIWIIISWFDWTFGATYSSRALTQSYPIFALSLASFINIMVEKKKQIFLYILLGLLTLLNFYQLSIYNQGILKNFSPLLAFFK